MRERSKPYHEAAYIPWRDYENPSPSSDRAFHGDALVAAAQELAAAFPGDYSAEVRDQTAAWVVDIAAKAQQGASALYLQWDDKEQRAKLDFAGRVHSPMALRYDLREGWHLDVHTEGIMGKQQFTRMWSASFSSILHSFDEVREPPYVAGSDDVKAWLSRNALTMLLPDDERPSGYLDWDVDQLSELNATTIPPSYLGLRAEQFGEALDTLFLGLLEEDDSTRMRQVLQSLKYLMRIGDGEEPFDALEAIMTRAANDMPLAEGGRRMTRQVISFAAKLAEQFRERFPSLMDISKNELAARIIADLYQHRADNLAAYSWPAPGRPVDEQTAEEPELRPLATAGGQVALSKAREDDSYITQLRRAGVPVGRLELGAGELHVIGLQYAHLILSSADLDEQLALFANFEYIFDADRPAARPGFYDEVCNKLAAWVPLSAEAERILDPYLVAARAMTIMHPPIATGRVGETLPGDAGTAAVMAGLYRRKATQLREHQAHGKEAELSKVHHSPGGAVDLFSMSEDQIAQALDEYEKPRRLQQYRRLLSAMQDVLRREDPKV